MPFFAFIIFQDLIASTFEISAAMILFLAVIFGAAQNVLSKAIKYSFFDPTKEMVYIPLDEDLKAKGKAAADVLGGRLGKRSIINLRGGGGGGGIISVKRVLLIKRLV